LSAAAWSTVLRLNGFEVIWAADGASPWALARAGPPDLLPTDRTMAGNNERRRRGARAAAGRASAWRRAWMTPARQCIEHVAASPLPSMVSPRIEAGIRYCLVNPGARRMRCAIGGSSAIQSPQAPFVPSPGRPAPSWPGMRESVFVNRQGATAGALVGF
jgi:hypothetical protein